MPLIRLIRPDLIKEWSKENEKLKYLEKSVLLKLSSISEALKSVTIGKGIAEIPIIKKYIVDIESLIKSNIFGKEVFISPSQTIVVYNFVKRLCCTIVELGYGDIVKDYVEVKYIQKYDFVHKNNGMQAYSCSDCGYVYDDISAIRDEDGNMICFEELEAWACPIDGIEHKFFQRYEYPVIKSTPTVLIFKFDSLIDEYINNKISVSFFNIDDDDEYVWADWALLETIRDCYFLDRNFFRRKKMYYKKSLLPSRNSGKLLNLKGLSSEMYFIRKKRQGHKRVIINTRKNIISVLQRVLDKVFNISVPQTHFSILPLMIQLELKDNDTHLNLSVEWMTGIVEVVNLHKFSNDDLQYNVIFDFIKNLLTQPGKLIGIKDASGANAKKFLDRVGIVGVLKDFFVAEIRAKKATLHALRINLTDKTNSKRLKLVSYIKKLEHVEWRFMK